MCFYMYIHVCVHACVYVHFCNTPPQVLKLASLALPPPPSNIEKLIHPSRVHKCKLTGGGHFATILVIGQSQYSYFGESLIRVKYIYTH